MENIQYNIFWFFFLKIEKENEYYGIWWDAYIKSSSD